MLTLAVALLGCASDADPSGASAARRADTGDPFEAYRLPDFTLQDVNPNSATYGDPVSPRDLLGKVSGWYFGHAT
jgi:hypothetical protein